MSKESITIRLQPELIDRLEEEAQEAGVSRSQHIRQTLRERRKKEALHEEVATLQSRLESREKRIEQLEDQLAKRSQIEEKVDTLAKQQDEPDAPFLFRWIEWWRER